MSYIFGILMQSFKENSRAVGLTLRRNIKLNAGQPSRAYTEVHSNSITALLFHPDNYKLLITASTDCLINIIQIDIAEEDDAIVSTATHDAGVHHIATATSGRTSATTQTLDLHAISHDERASSYHLDADGLEERKGSQLDIKDRMKIDYTICTRSRGEAPGIWVCMGVNKPYVLCCRFELYVRHECRG